MCKVLPTSASIFAPASSPLRSERASIGAVRCGGRVKASTCAAPQAQTAGRARVRRALPENTLGNRFLTAPLLGGPRVFLWRYGGTELTAGRLSGRPQEGRPRAVYEGAVEPSRAEFELDGGAAGGNITESRNSPFGPQMLPTSTALRFRGAKRRARHFYPVSLPALWPEFSPDSRNETRACGESGRWHNILWIKWKASPLAAATKAWRAQPPARRAVPPARQMRRSPSRSSPARPPDWRRRSSFSGGSH